MRGACRSTSGGTPRLRGQSLPGRTLPAAPVRPSPIRRWCCCAIGMDRRRCSSWSPSAPTWLAPYELQPAGPQCAPGRRRRFMGGSAASLAGHRRTRTRRAVAAGGVDPDQPAGGLSSARLLSATFGVTDWLSGGAFSRLGLEQAVLTLVDFQASMPFMIIALAVLAFFGNTLTAVHRADGFLRLGAFAARIARGLTIAANEQGYASAVTRDRRVATGRVYTDATCCPTSPAP